MLNTEHAPAASPHSRHARRPAAGKLSKYIEIGHYLFTTMRRLEKLTIKNFKSIREQTLALGKLNVFIGGNGAGKSNLIEAFRFLREIMNQNLAGYTGTKGGADTLLYFGRKRSPEMSFRLEFGEGDTSNAYLVELQGTAEDALILATERAYYHERKQYRKPFDLYVASAARESKLKQTDHICTRQVM